MRSPNLPPSEIICNESYLVSGMDLEDLKNRLGISLSSLESWYFDDEMCKKTLMEHFQWEPFRDLALEIIVVEPLRQEHC